MHPPVHVGASRPEQFTICKIKELNDYRRLKPRGHQIYVDISRGANIAPCPRVFDVNYQTGTHGDDHARCKECIIIFSTDIPEYVIQCKVLSQWITIYTLHQYRDRPCSVSGVCSLCSGWFGQSRCTNTAPLGHSKSLTPISDPTQLSHEWHCQKLFCRIWFNENSDTRVPGLPGGSKLQTNLDSKASHHDHDSAVAHITEVDWVRCKPLLANPSAVMAARLSFIDCHRPIDCLSPCNL